MRIYAYTTSEYPDCIKVGQTSGDVTKRILEQVGTANIAYKLLWQDEVRKPDGSFTTDHEIHDVLQNRMKKRRLASVHGRKDSEVFRCTLSDVLTAVAAIRTGRELDVGRHKLHDLRNEQSSAVEVTARYFQLNPESLTGIPPRFLWNAKMRFGKTFTTYQLARKLGYSRILVLTYKPAVADSWKNDLLEHVDFQGWRFHERSDKRAPDMLDARPLVWFASFQDVLGKSKGGSVKDHNKVLIETDWDLVVFDEYHYGAWRDNAQEMFATQDIEVDLNDEPTTEDVENRIRGANFLYLSGTPFRALNTGEFAESQIFNWTYPDEQEVKEHYLEAGITPNYYAALPRMELRTYLLSDLALGVAKSGEADVFSLSTLFSARENKDVEAAHPHYHFDRPDYVSAFLRTISGRSEALVLNDMCDRDDESTSKSSRAPRPDFPYAEPFRSKLRHTVWYLPDVASCYAMEDLLSKDPEFERYLVLNIAGKAAPVGVAALVPVTRGIQNLQGQPTITLSCGKLMTGVTVPEWSAILMLRGMNRPESYFQAAFRVQSQWVTPDPLDPTGSHILKDICYVFDFDPQRALRLVGEMAISLSHSQQSSPVTRVADFTRFLPIFCFDGGSMQRVDAAEILTIAESGTTSTMMVKKWKSAGLVRMEGPAFEALKRDADLTAALGQLEQFRKQKVSAASTADLVIASNRALNKAKLQKRAPTDKEDEAAREARKQKKKMQVALIGFLQRIPAFMYVTDARETGLVDVIRGEEGRRFERATGLSLEMFERLRATGILNDSRIDAAIIAFKQYEDASLEYAGNAQDRSSLLGGMETTYTREQQKELLDGTSSDISNLMFTPSGGDRAVNTLQSSGMEKQKVRDRSHDVDVQRERWPESAALLDLLQEALNIKGYNLVSKQCYVKVLRSSQLAGSLVLKANGVEVSVDLTPEQAVDLRGSLRQKGDTGRLVPGDWAYVVPINYDNYQVATAMDLLLRVSTGKDS